MISVTCQLSTLGISLVAHQGGKNYHCFFEYLNKIKPWIIVFGLWTFIYSKTYLASTYKKKSFVHKKLIPMIIQFVLSFFLCVRTIHLNLIKLIKFNSNNGCSNIRVIIQCMKSCFTVLIIIYSPRVLAVCELLKEKDFWMPSLKEGRHYSLKGLMPLTLSNLYFSRV